MTRPDPHLATRPSPDPWAGPPAWALQVLPDVPALVTELLGTPPRPVCSVTAVVVEAATRRLSLARLHPAPACVDDPTAETAVRRLVVRALGAAPRPQACWIGLLVQRTVRAATGCDLGWTWALLGAAAGSGALVLDVAVQDLSGTRSVCHPAAAVGATARPWSGIRSAVDVPAKECLQGYEQDRRGRWLLPRHCADLAG